METLFEELDVSEATYNARELFSKFGARRNQWLNTTQQIWGVESPYRSLGALPEGAVRTVALRCLVEWRKRGVTPNTVYLQRNEVGSCLARHRDPFSDKHFTTILYLGDFVGSKLVAEGCGEVSCAPGKCVMLPCTVNGRQGPYHWTTPHESGERWTLIMNHVRK